MQLVRPLFPHERGWTPVLVLSRCYALCRQIASPACRGTFSQARQHCRSWWQRRALSDETWGKRWWSPWVRPRSHPRAFCRLHLVSAHLACQGRMSKWSIRRPGVAIKTSGQVLSSTSWAFTERPPEESIRDTFTNRKQVNLVYQQSELSVRPCMIIHGNAPPAAATDTGRLRRQQHSHMKQNYYIACDILLHQ